MFRFSHELVNVFLTVLLMSLLSVGSFASPPRTRVKAPLLGYPNGSHVALAGSPSHSDTPHSHTVAAHDAVQNISGESATVSRATLPAASILWSADMETGDLREWYKPCSSATPCGAHGGGEFDSGNGASVASQDIAHTGTWSAKLTIDTAIGSTGTRLFRWAESQKYPELYYSVWYYFPQKVRPANWWNVFQWKSKHSAGNDSFFALNVGNRSNGNMYFYLYDSHRRISYGQSVKDVSVGTWIHVEAFYRCAGDNAGRVTFWQDGMQILDVTGVPTRYADGDCQWSVNNYSNKLNPSKTTIYIDDVAISQTRVRTSPIPGT